jgi:hypothetical protein
MDSWLFFWGVIKILMLLRICNPEVKGFAGFKIPAFHKVGIANPDQP